MSSNGTPAIVLVHGAWHVPEHYTDFIARLQHAGFEVSCPLLPTCDQSKRPNADLYADAQVVRDIVISLIDQSREVVMILHSYGGAVGAEVVKGLSMRERAAEGFQGGVTHLIYMCGFMLQVGESVGGASLPRPDPDPVEFDDATKTTFLCESPVQLFYADVEPNRAKELESLLVRQDARAMSDTVTHPAWQYVPTTYLRTTEDQVLFLEWQDRQIEAVRNKGSKVRVETFKSSHSPFISLAEDMVAAVERAVG
ncbi:MAG: hypothetical protein LQ346_005873 [Caloplaca aetnensis]|nr:MAG: hypothetical protein LQ346_005873 [Caloplaca aetnensis]